MLDMSFGGEGRRPPPRLAFLLLLLHPSDVFSTLGLAVRRAHVGPPLPFARVLSGAGMSSAGTGALALARVHAAAVDLVAAGLLLGARRQSASQQQGRGRAGDEDAGVDALHVFLLGV